MNASIVDVLSGLFSTAVDCMFPVGKESFDLVEQFICRYRISNYYDEAELATFQVNAQELGKPVGNDLPDTISKKSKNNKRESAARRKRKSLSGLSDVNANTSSNDCQMPGKKMKQKRKMEEATLGQQLKNIKTNLIGGSSKYSSIPQTSPNLSCFANEEKTVRKKRKKIEAQENESAQITSECTDAEKLKGNSLVIDLQFTSPPAPPVDISERNKSGNKEELVFISANPESCVSQEGPVGRINDNSLSLITKAEADTVLVNKTALKNSIGKAAGVHLNNKRAVGMPHNCLGKAAEAHLNTKLAVEQTGLNNSMEKAAEEPLNTKLALAEPRLMDSTEMAAEKPLNTKSVIEIPDLNGSGAECNSISTEFDTVNLTSIELKPEQSTLSACSRPIKTKICWRRKDGGESLGNCLLLRFAPVANIPSKQDLLTTFCRFGPLKLSETQLLKDTGSAQLVFVRSKDAAAAFHSLEQNKFVFGSTLVDYKLHSISAPRPPVVQLMIPSQATGFMAIPGVTPTQPTGSMTVPGVTPVQPTGSMAMPGVNTAQPSESMAVTPTQPILSMARPGVTHNQPTVSMAEPGVTPTQQTGSTVPMLGETPPSLQDMKQKLLMMNSVLENSGGSLSPQMRAKLDSEIKNLLRKVNSRIKV